MGKLVQVNRDFQDVFFPNGVTCSAGQQTTLTDAQFTSLPLSVTRLITVISTVPDPTTPATAPSDITKAASQVYVDTQLGLLPSTYVPRWKPNATYTTNQQVVSPNNDVVSAIAGFTSGATYDPTKWTLSGTYALVAGATRNALTGWYHADGFGVVFDGVTVTTTALQAMLTAVAAAGGGVAYVPAAGAKVCLIDASLVISSNTTLRLDPAVTIKLKAGSNCNMLVNTAVTAARTVMDAAITTGTASLTSATAAFTGADTGASVCVWGAGQGGSNLTATMTYVNATTVTLAVNAITTVTAACASVGPRDSGIVVEGGTWDRGTDGGGGFFNSHCLRFRRVDNIKVQHLTGKSAGGKFFIHYADATQFEATDLQLTTNSDGVHVNGPARAGKISNIRGTTGDDFVALGCNDYAGYNDTFGPITDVSVEDLYPVNSLANGCHMWAGPGMVMDDIRVRRVGGAVGFVGVAFTEDITHSTTVGGTFGDISIRDVWTRCGTAASGQSAVAVFNSGTFKTLTIDGVTFNPLHIGVPAFACQPAAGGGAGTIQSLAVRRLTALSLAGAGAYGVIVSAMTVLNAVLDSLSMPDSSTGAIAVYLAGGTVGQLELRNPCLVFGDITSTCVTVDATSTCGRVVYLGGSITQGVNLVATGAGTPGTVQVSVTGTRCVGINRLSNVNSPMEWDLNNVYVSNPANPLFYLGQAASTLRLRGSALATVGTVTMFQRSAAQSITVQAPTLKVDFSFVTQQAGDCGYNTNTAVAPYAAGTAYSDGTTWRLATTGATRTGTAVLVAGTVTVADTLITANSVIRVASKTSGGSPGALFISGKIAATSFTVTSTNAADTSTVQYDVITY